MKIGKRKQPIMRVEPCGKDSISSPPELRE